MDHKKPLYSIIPMLVLLSLTIISCKGKSEVTLASDSIVIEDAFKKSNGELCKIKTTVFVSFPESHKDKSSSEQLKQLFCKHVLHCPDSATDIKQALNYYAKWLIAQNAPLRTDQDSEVAEEDYENIDIDDFEITVRITNVYNNNDLLSFCCAKVIKKNDKETSVTHRYVNLDLSTMKKLSHNDLFYSSGEGQINQMLKSKLIESQNVKDEDELYMCGYYNLSNLTVTDNFYFGENGITWCYEPGVLAVPAVGETSLLLPFEELMRFKCEESALNRI